MNHPPSSDRPLVVTFVVMLFIALWAFSLSWHESLLDRHEFRQLQTAINTHWVVKEGYKLDYETPIFGPPWSIPFEFPVYQWSVAAFSQATGMPVEQSGRAVSILYFLATLPAIYLLAALFGLARAPRLLVVAAVLSSPVYLFYVRSFMIETTALCFATWFLLAVGRAVRDLQIRWSVVAAACGGLAALAKVTTFAVYCFPAAGLTLWLGWPHWTKRTTAGTAWIRAILLATWPVTAAVLVGAWWVRHGDQLKDSNPFAGFLKSTELRSWNWGTLAMRLSPEFWKGVADNIASNVLSLTSLAVVLLCATTAARRTRLFALAGTLAFVTGFLLFPNLYQRHDYYYAANALLLLMAAGGILADAWSSSRLPRSTLYLALFLFFGAQLNAFYRSYGFYHRQHRAAPPEITQVIREVTAPDDIVLIYGWDWNTLLPYYAQRRTVMVPGGREYEFKVLEDVLARLPPRRIQAMVVHRELFDASPAYIQERAARFGLFPAPFATSADGDLYLTPESFSRAARTLGGRNFPTVTLNTSQAADRDEDSLKDNPLAGMDITIASPKPVRARSQFGVGMSSQDDRPILLANAPSEIWLEPPPGANRITAEFGLVPSAYDGGNPVTDGVGVTIYEIRPEGLRRTLYTRQLDPAHNLSDRGLQRIELPGAGPFGGRLLFKVDPGPKGSVVKDWFFWSQIEVR